MKKQQQAKLKKQATTLRQHGFTFPEIQKRTGVAYGTLSGWFKGLILPNRANKRILRRKRQNLEVARKKARQSNKFRLQEKYAKAEAEMDQLISKVQLSRGVFGLILASLYLGEGAKRKSTLIFANSNPAIIKLYLRLLQTTFQTDLKRYRVVLYLRMDQNEKTETSYWAKITKISRKQFKKTQFDQGTLGKKTFSTYHGVCAVAYNDAEVEKRLTILQHKVLDLILGT